MTGRASASPCRDNPWTCPICTRQPCRCLPSARVVTFDSNPDWVDPEVVERIVADRVARPLTRAEKHAAAARLAGRGASCNAIALRLGMGAGAVRALLGEESA